LGWNEALDNHLNITCDWTANGYRLPTEMEWMFAARGGNYSAGYLYSGSNDVDAVAWYTPNSEEETHLVGLKLPNELGLYDMSGNVWEYCWDIFAPLSSSDQVNPVGAATGVSRAIRGGSCMQDASNCTISRRFNLLPLIATNIVGFRVVRKA
jgi:formylglycine-generating enzyme required for sulfatase activity